ncbi:hypothetical protein EDD22DRAFT_946950 [Suillus occidentalis]|nr:hypothetical protein EDD22DRAFT_961071 [Suillus occidentalis]KAG1773529.1 hypothetical protein EDD22DRAFT_946950 [Suillus occidentalis]
MVEINKSNTLTSSASFNASSPNSQSMATGLLSTITVHPDIEFQGINQGPLQSVLLTICFSGKLPTQVIERNSPVHISISFGEEYASFTSPVVEAVSMDLCSSSGESMHPDGASLCSQGDTNSPAHQDVSDDIQIPFLPLRHFDNSDWNTWATLSKNIESWLVDVGSETQLWTWGRDAFWLAFIAAYPLFPRGSWPKWDSRIPLEGPFIERWLEQSGDHTVIAQEQDSIRVDIWDEFCKHAALFFPHSLVVSD